MKAVFLCGGRGKRMFPITEDKFFLDFLGKPLLEHQIKLACDAGLNQFVVGTQPQTDIPQENFHQAAMHDMLGGGEKIWGWKNEPVVMHETITSGEGLIKGTNRLSDQDSERRTAQMFGF